MAISTVPGVGFIDVGTDTNIQNVPGAGFITSPALDIINAVVNVSLEIDSLVGMGEFYAFAYDSRAIDADPVDSTTTANTVVDGNFGGEASYTIPSSVLAPLSTELCCDICGLDYKYYELRKRWDGFKVCDECYETRHILDFYKIKNVRPQMPPVDRRSIPTDTITDPSPSITGQEGILLEDAGPQDYPAPIIIAENGDFIIQE